MKRQCAWCKRVFDIKTKTWKQIETVIMPNATHGMCPECEAKTKEEFEELRRAV